MYHNFTNTKNQNKTKKPELPQSDLPTQNYDVFVAIEHILTDDGSCMI